MSYSTEKNTNLKIAVVIPCYRERSHIMDVINKTPSFVDQIFCVDDACPENSGQLVEKKLFRSKG